MIPTLKNEIVAARMRPIGGAPYANTYRVELVGAISAASEIEEVIWVDPAQPHHLELAPLTRETVLPLATGAAGR